MIHYPKKEITHEHKYLFRYRPYVYTVRVTRYPFIFYLCIAMNHLAIQVCGTISKVTFLRHDVNHTSQQ